MEECSSALHLYQHVLWLVLLILSILTGIWRNITRVHMDSQWLKKQTSDCSCLHQLLYVVAIILTFFETYTMRADVSLTWLPAIGTLSSYWIALYRLSMRALPCICCCYCCAFLLSPEGLLFFDGKKKGQGSGEKVW